MSENDLPQQEMLFEYEKTWEQHWKGMPEFCQNDLDPIKQLIVSFSSLSDLEKFAKLVNQRITFNTKSIWFPCVEATQQINKRYVSEPDGNNQ